MAPPPAFDTREVALLVGTNPPATMAGGLPLANPGRELTDAVGRFDGFSGTARPLDGTEAVQARAAALAPLLPPHALLWQREDTVPYECDGLTAYRERPLVVALPETDEQVQAVLKTCHGLDVPVVARGAGTGLSGGAMPHAMGVTLSLAKDPAERSASLLLA